MTRSATPATAKVFTNGGSQAVRLPRAFRFNETEVLVQRIGNAILLCPKASAWDLLESAIGSADDDFLPRRDQPARSRRRRRLS